MDSFQDINRRTLVNTELMWVECHVVLNELKEEELQNLSTTLRTHRFELGTAVTIYNFEIVSNGSRFTI